MVEVKKWREEVARQVLVGASNAETLILTSAIRKFTAAYDQLFGEYLKSSLSFADVVRDVAKNIKKFPGITSEIYLMLNEVLLYQH